MTRRSLLSLSAALSLRGQQASTRDAFLRLIGRPRVPLAPQERQLVAGAFPRLHFRFASQAGQRVPGVIVKPAAAARLPAVVVLHGTGGSKEGQLPLLERLAARGFLAAAIDGRYHGERAGSATGSAAYVDAILRAWRGSGEYPFLYDTVWDILRLLDYLGTRPDVDPARIGMIGFSKGGMELYLAAAVDPRIAVAVPCIGV